MATAPADAPVASAAPPTPRPSVRILESPSVAWAQRENAKQGRDARKTEAKPWSGTVLDTPVVEGIAQVDESRTLHETRGDGSIVDVPLWHYFIQVLGFRDITPDDHPPVFPLPGHKPYKGSEYANPTPNAPRTRIVPR